jgi:hypothetical protein
MTLAPKVLDAAEVSKIRHRDIGLVKTMRFKTQSQMALFCSGRLRLFVLVSDQSQESALFRSILKAKASILTKTNK